MSKVFLIGDTHLALGFPNKADKWFNVHQEYFKDFLIPFLKKEVKEDDIIVHLGDLFDNRDIIPINILNYGLDIVLEISKIAPFHIIIGNHDCWSKSSDEINTIRPFKFIPNVFVYDKVTQIEHNKYKLVMMPYIEKKKEQIEYINKFKGADYLLCHSDLNGARMHLTSVGHRNHDKIELDEFKAFKRVYSGHIHIVDRHKNFTFVGSNFQMDRNDYNDQKGIFVLDLETGEDQFIHNNISPVFKKIRIKDETHIDILEDLKLSKDYIDIEISNSLLVSNRKLRRKLEILLEKSRFETISYIDDITNDLEDVLTENNSITEEEASSSISIKLDYEEYIKEYIKTQKYDNDNFKNGLMNEYDSIIEIYKNNYKNNE
jgi:predicted MPP superfamily phosphohydrolase